jgi:hypothetical protein
VKLFLKCFLRTRTWIQDTQRHTYKVSARRAVNGDARVVEMRWDDDSFHYLGRCDGFCGCDLRNVINGVEGLVRL